MPAPCPSHGARPRIARWLVVALSVALALSVAAACGAAPRTRHPIVLLRPSTGVVFMPAAEAFRARCDEPVVEIVFDKQDPESATRVVRAAQPSVIVALGARAARLAHERFPMVPLVYGMVGDPARLTLAGANATGVSAEVSAEVELTALRAIVPDVTRVAFLYGSGACASRLRDAQAAAGRAGITLVEVPVSTPAELPERLHGAMNDASALWLAPDTLLAAPETFRFIVEQTIQHRTPLFVFAPPLVRAGALAAVAPDMAWVGAELAERVRRIRAGARARDLPVSAARSSGIVFNPATARAIGIAMPADARPLAEAGPP